MYFQGEVVYWSFKVPFSSQNTGHSAVCQVSSIFSTNSSGFTDPKHFPAPWKNIGIDLNCTVSLSRKIQGQMKNTVPAKMLIPCCHLSPLRYTNRFVAWLMLPSKFPGCFTIHLSSIIWQDVHGICLVVSKKASSKDSVCITIGVVKQYINTHVKSGVCRNIMKN